jgi:hypothetical protein
MVDEFYEKFCNGVHNRQFSKIDVIADEFLPHNEPALKAELKVYKYISQRSNKQSFNLRYFARNKEYDTEPPF